MHGAPAMSGHADTEARRSVLTALPCATLMTVAGKADGGGSERARRELADIFLLAVQRPLSQERDIPGATLSLTPSHTLSHTLPLTLSHTHSLSLSLSLSLSHTRSHAHTHTHTHTRSLSLSLGASVGRC